MRHRYQVGELSRIDANLAQSEVHVAEAELIESEASLLQAEQAMQTLTGAAAPMDMDTETPATRSSPGGNSSAFESHPQLLAAAAASRGARAKAKIASESRRAAPELALRVVRERGDFAEPYANSVGIRLKIPFSSAPRVRRESSAAEAEVAQADAEMRRIMIRVQLDAERAQRASHATERQFAMAQERRTLSAENLRLIEKAFSLGESDLATLLRIRAAAFDAEALLGRQRVARAVAVSRLNQSLGVLP
ncbi:MAG: TolC family protein [Betaproteobacteria bacterium]|nr:TolC family protein [Betaproteobacteria bacterium]